MPNVDTGATEQIAKILLEHGQRYIPAVLPDDVAPYPPGKCFDAAWINAFHSDGKYQYVEGLALDPDNHFYWVLHAWVTDGVYAYDPTWYSTDDAGKPQPLPTLYLGIAMETLDVAAFVRGADDYVSVFGNRWRNPQLADRAIYGK